MRELLPAPPKGLADLFEPIGDFLGLPLLPQHVHEILFSYLFYELLYTTISPRLSSRIFPKIYQKLDKRATIDWNVHVVSLTQCSLIAPLAAFALIFDQERKNMTWQERVWGYTGVTNTLIGIANGYFVWHLLRMIKYYKIYGWSMVAHGISALAIMMSGFRPAFNCYAQVGLLYELTNIPLNIHRFMIKVGMEGSRAQLINGTLLVVTFLFVRIVYGSFTVFWLFYDMYRVATETVNELMLYSSGGKSWQLEVPLKLPTWIIVLHFLAETTVHILNFVWFYKMMNLLLKRIRRLEAKKATENGSVNGMPNGKSKKENSMKYQIEQAVLKATSRGLIHFEDLPEPWKINPHILEGYRFTDSISACCKSILQYSNESFNIWSHLLPLLTIIFISTNMSVSFLISELNTSTDTWIQRSYIFAVAACLACSSIWHTMKCISHEHLMRTFASVDMMGVSILISATSVMTEYTGFYCDPWKQVLYISITCVSGLACMILPWQEWVRRPSAAWIRVGLFVLLGISGLVSAMDMAFSQGLQRTIENYESVVLKVVIPVLGGAIVYASKFPERWWPGRFDFVGSSHNLWHLAVLFAMWGGFSSMQDGFQNVDLRAEGGCR